MWELDCSTQGTRVALQRARRALQRHGGNRVLFHGYSRVLKRFPLDRSHVPALLLPATWRDLHQGQNCIQS